MMAQHKSAAEIVEYMQGELPRFGDYIEHSNGLEGRQVGTMNTVWAEIAGAFELLGFDKPWRDTLGRSANNEYEILFNKARSDTQDWLVGSTTHQSEVRGYCLLMSEEDLDMLERVWSLVLNPADYPFADFAEQVFPGDVLRGLRVQIDGQKRIIASLDEQLEATRKARDEALDELSTAEVLVQETNERATDLDGKLSKMSAERDNLQVDNDDLRCRVDDLEQEVVRLKVLMFDLSEEKGALESRLRKMRDVD
jgi:regulator of replication initiation timing